MLQEATKEEDETLSANALAEHSNSRHEYLISQERLATKVTVKGALEEEGKKITTSACHKGEVQEGGRGRSYHQERGRVSHLADQKKEATEGIVVDRDVAALIKDGLFSRLHCHSG